MLSPNFQEGKSSLLSIYLHDVGRQAHQHYCYGNTMGHVTKLLFLLSKAHTIRTIQGCTCTPTWKGRR